MTQITATQPLAATDTGLDVVTGAFSYSGRAIASALVGSGRRVRTITGHPNRAPAGSPLEVAPLDFDDRLGLVASLRGATTLYNTYWVRFAHGRIDHELAIANSRALFSAARRAGVQRIVHVSITHPSLTRPGRTSGARHLSSGRWPKQKCPTPLSGRPSSSAVTGCC
jgi:nucleoside-diphosphate-sugar epimerase